MVMSVEKLAAVSTEAAATIPLDVYVLVGGRDLLVPLVS